MKNTKKIKKQTMLKVAHEMAKSLYKANIIDVATMKEYDALCLPLVEEPTPKNKLTGS